MIKKIPEANGLVTTTVLNTQMKKIPDNSSLVTITVLNIKIGDVDNNIHDYAKYIITPGNNKLTEEI